MNKNIGVLESYYQKVNFLKELYKIEKDLSGELATVTKMIADLEDNLEYDSDMLNDAQALESIYFGTKE